MVSVKFQSGDFDFKVCFQDLKSQCCTPGIGKVPRGASKRRDGLKVTRFLARFGEIIITKQTSEGYTRRASVGNSSGRRVRTSTPSLVTATVCSN